MTGVLTLIPTPIDEESSLELQAFDVLKNAALDLDSNAILIEDLKPCRQRWLRWGLPREAVEEFIEYNEHSRDEILSDLLLLLKSGKNLYLMSDGGLPAFCDPGQILVRECHKNGIRVTSTPFCNSISLAVALSGIDCNSFYFAGFLPKKSEERSLMIQKYIKEKDPVVIMDTPYRLMRTLEDISKIDRNKYIFLGLDLNSRTEELHYGKVNKIIEKITDPKREFILIFNNSY